VCAHLPDRDPVGPGALIEGRDSVIVRGDHQRPAARGSILPPRAVQLVEHRIALPANALAGRTRTRAPRARAADSPRSGQLCQALSAATHCFLAADKFRGASRNVDTSHDGDLFPSVRN
jgi:hypothetical protein